MADAYAGNVVLLTHLDASPPTDVTGRHTLTVNGAATVQNTNAKFGYALSCPGSAAADRVTTPINSDFTFTLQAFTVELWVRVVGTGVQNILRIGDPGAEIVSITYNGGTFGYKGGALLPSTSFIGANTFDTTRNSWVHLAVDRPMNASAVYFYVNGTVYQGATGDGNSLMTPTGSVHIGGDNTTALNGQVDEVRVTKGVARYHGVAFTAPTAAFDDSAWAATARPVVNVVT